MIPVSKMDLQLQLAWYGYIISVNEEGQFIFEELQMPMKDKKIGTHPTPEEVVDFNETYKDELEEASLTFRDFHTLDFGLVK